MISKFKVLVVVLILAGQILAACGPKATPVTTPAMTEEAYPAPGQTDAYPAPPVQSVQTFNPYPGPSEGVTNYVDWSKAEELIMGAQVSKAYHAAQHVTLVLKDGTVALTVQPALDELSKTIEKCGEPCKDIEQISQ